MPFLSKKVKSARISQFVNDQFHNSRKNRLETGFPTSLIDLFIKNRSKLKTKKRRNPPISDFKDQISDSKDQIIVESPPSIDSPPRCPSPPLHISPPPSEISAVGCVDEIDGQDDGKLHKVLFGVLKIFLVVVMALGSKKFVIGITISAFLLLLIEYLGRSIPTFSRFRDVELHERNNETKSLDQEIQEIEEIQLTDELNFENQESGDFLDKESGVIGSESRTKSRKSNIKSRMKKFVPKKFKTSRKKPDEQADQGNSGESESIHSSVSSSSRMHGDEDPSARLREVTEETTTKIEEVEGGLTWRHLVLCLIVLIGLIGGRVFALVLTLSWFLLLKLGKYPRFMNKVHVKSL